MPFVVIESDHTRFEDCAHTAGAAIWGDAVLEPVLQAAQLSEARLLLITVPDASSIRMIIKRARELNPGIDIIARAQLREHLDEFRQLDIYEVVQPEFEAGLEMVRQVLDHYGFSPLDILRFSDAVHDEVYQPFRVNRAPGQGLQSLESLRRATRSIEIEWVAVPDNSFILGRTIGDAQFRTRTGASIVAVRNDDDLLANPTPDYAFRRSDQLGVLGTTAQRRNAQDLIHATSW